MERIFPHQVNASHIGRNVWPSKYQASGSPGLGAGCPVPGTDVARTAMPWMTSVLTLQVKPDRILYGVENQTRLEYN